MMDFSPLPWGEGGESSEPGEGFILTEPRNLGIRVEEAWTGRVAFERSGAPLERRRDARA